MSTVILSAASSELPALQELARVLRSELARAGETEIRSFELAQRKLGYCQGEFDCWLKTPGSCRTHDLEQEIVSAVHGADRVVILDRVTFGGYSYTCKRAIDRLICLLLPFFEKRAALTHHSGRYEHAASFFALGWNPTPDAALSQTWNGLAEAKAINLLAPRWGAACVSDVQRAAWPAAVSSMLESRAEPGTGLHAREPLRAALELAAQPSSEGPPPTPVQRVALLVGSAKIKGTSVSENLARALCARFTQAGVSAELHFVTELLHDAVAPGVAQQLAAADLLVLVTPLYVDCLPALAVRALEHVAARRVRGAAPGRFALLVNCGFPEPEQNRTALRIGRHFAHDAAYHFAGGLPLGAGGTVDARTPLDAQHGPAEHVKRALDAAAAALAQGQDIPQAAVELMARAPMPDQLYHLAAHLGFRYQAYKNHLRQRDLHAQPLTPR